MPHVLHAVVQHSSCWAYLRNDGARWQGLEAPHPNLLLLGLHESVEDFC